MGNIYVEIPAPANWQDFERLTLDICRARWKDEHAELNGRPGQEQHGVDVYGYNHVSQEHTGVQCKKRRTRSLGITAPSHALTTAEIDAEVLATKSSRSDLDRFIIATTGDRDGDLQTHVRQMNTSLTGMKVSLWFWDDFVEDLNNQPNLMYRYYENVLKFREKYSADEHYLRMLAMAFDREAIRTQFDLENRVDHFLQGLKDVQEAISTGVLKNREGRFIDLVRLPHKLPDELKNAKKHLQQTRDLATQGFRDGVIIQQGENFIEIHDPGLRDELNNQRKCAVEQLNILLRSSKIEEIIIV